MFLPKLVPLTSTLSALLKDGMRTASQDTPQLKQLREVIMEHGRMLYNLYSYQPVRVEIKELAYRLRESPADVLAALALLEEEGQAFHTSCKGLWKLRIAPDQKAKTERGEN